eukprot:TRINITY_DN17133_c0_g1_i1.p1 TRINITY_DN17133_c0_g1~~TRINITY_DN17133_c0_g1_i1.p1  ORF type:complete len:427 (+),score=93.04 TRINITY_DN17133_c0_g1_i1:73-1281(+)
MSTHRLLASFARSPVASNRALRLFGHLSPMRKPSSVYAMRSFTTAVSDDESVLCEIHGKCGTAILNREKALNSLSLPMIRGLTSLYKQWEADDNIAVIALRGAGPKAFCAGGDVVAIHHAGKSGEPLTDTFFREEYELDYQISQLNTPHVALITGITMGGGVGVSVNGKYRVASNSSRFAMPETAIGFFPDVGGSYFLSRLERGLGMYLGLSGSQLRGYDVFDAGIATHYVEEDQMPSLVKRLHAVTSPDQVNGVLAEFTAAHGSQASSALSPKVREAVARCFEKDSIEEIFEALKNEKEEKEWAKKTLASMKLFSPTSLKVVHRQLVEGGKKSLKECFEMEFAISQTFMSKKQDFFEGVRALLVDKDRKPKWNPATVAEVSDEEVNDYFQPLPENTRLVLP